MLQGEPGIGKTTVWRHGVQQAEHRGMEVLTATAVRSETHLAFAGLGDLFERAVDRIGELPDPQRHALQVALLLSEPGKTPLDPRAIGLAVLTLLKRLAHDAPLLLAIDDVQWLDGATASALGFAIRRLRREPVGVLVAHRLGEALDSVPLGLDRALGPRLVRLKLVPLSLGALHRILVSRLGVTLPRPALARLHEACRGNPFFALEIAAVLNQGGESLECSSPLPIPGDLHDVLRRRIAGVSGTAREVLLAAATAADPEVDLIETLTSRMAIEEALAAGMVIVKGARLRFVHPLLAEAVCSYATPRSRREVHRRLAEVLTDSDECARHLGLATDTPDEVVAAELDTAAARVYHRGAPATAAQLADHACRLTPEGQSESMLARTTRSAEYHLAAGDTTRGRALLEKVVRLREPGPERARVLLCLGRVHCTSSDLASGDRVFRQALAEAGDDLRLSAESQQALAFTAMGRGELLPALEYARASLQQAEQLDEPGLLALALCRVAQAEFLTGGGFDRARMEAAVRLEEHVGDVPVEWLPSYAYSYVALFAGDLQTPPTLLEALYRSALEQGDERALTSLLIPMSMRERAAGNWRVAGQYAAEASERCRQSRQGITLLLALSEQAFVSALTGNVDASRAAAEEGLRIAGEAGAFLLVPIHIAVLGFLELSLGDAAATHRLLGPLADGIVAGGLAEPGVARFLPDEIEALIALGEYEAARALLVLLEERARVLDRASALAAAARCRAALEAARADFVATRKSIAHALDQHARLDEPFEFGRTLLVQGGVERRARQHRAARTALERALEVFDQLGAPLWAKKAQAELARIGGRTASPVELTPTEQRVATLVAKGKTNREVAAELFVTVNTIEAALTRIYGKLNVRSRTELARRLADPSKL